MYILFWRIHRLMNLLSSVRLSARATSQRLILRISFSPYLVTLVTMSPLRYFQILILSIYTLPRFVQRPMLDKIERSDAPSTVCQGEGEKSAIFFSDGLWYCPIVWLDGAEGADCVEGERKSFKFIAFKKLIDWLNQGCWKAVCLNQANVKLYWDHSV